MKPPTPKRQATKTRQPIKHSKTFSGCWTCRERHVKCPEERPACTRCLKGGFECQGYGIKLVWIDPDTQEREQNIRRAIGAPAVYEDDSSFMQVDVHGALDVVETLSTDAEEICSGPFSVFTLKDYRKHSCGTGDRLISSPGPQQAAAPADTVSNFTKDDFGDVEIEAEDEDEDEDIETVVSQSITDAATSLYQTETLDNDPIYPSFHSLTTRHLDLLPRPAEQRALIHHWTNFVCWHLVPVDRPDNPFRSVFTPLALAGLNSPSNQSNGQIALFHSLCAASAFSRGQLLHGDLQNLTLGMKHYNLAIMHLRHSLETLKEDNLEVVVHRQRAPILATITMFSAMDMITGRSSEWRTHLQGGASWLATLENSVWHRDKSSSMIYQGYLAIAALCNINLPSTIDVDSDTFLDPNNYVLDRFFGLTQPMLKHIVVMNSLIKRIASSAANPDPAVLDDLETQLYMQTPENLDLGDLLDPVTRTLTLHHAYIFYYASLIYFQRTVRRRAPADVQDLVASAVGRLEDIERLGGDAIGCTLVWPPFVVACECLTTDLQERMLAWYMLKRRHGFMNLEMSKDIAQELWRRRGSRDPAVDVDADVDIQWQDVLKDLKMDIVLA